MKNAQTLQQAEKRVTDLLKKHGITKVEITDIKKWIWNATGPGGEASRKYQKKCLNLFPPTDDINKLNDLLQVFVDAWNFFPHKELKGRSPHDLITEEMAKHPPTSKNKNAMPKMIIGGREMEWDEFHAMIAEMEKVQKPFKKWIEKDALPKYKKYLEQVVKTKKTCECHYNVADIFFERVLHVGFVDLESIRPEFIRSEFPHWWPSHVMYSKLNPLEVKKSLDLLFVFIAVIYGIKR